MLTTLSLLLTLSLQTAATDDLATVAESSGYRATATSAQVIELLQRIEQRSEVMHIGELGVSHEGKSLPLVVLADPPLQTAEAARASGKPIVFAYGNIHAGEVCGKEALLALVRELATTPGHPLLEGVVLLVAPNYNPDGNDKMDTKNRRGQVGPELGMGERANGQGFDLNRDWIKLEAPETRAFVKLLTEWDPHLVIDTHTTNGSQHHYTLTYAMPNNPSGHAASIAFQRDELLPEVGKRMLESTGYDSFFYGNFNRDHTVWSSYSADPRHGCPYRGLRGQMSILSEAYAYATYEDRVLATYAFVSEIVRYVQENADRVNQLHEDAIRETVEAGLKVEPDDFVGLRHRVAAYTRPVTLRGYEWEVDEDGRRQRTDRPKDYTVVHAGSFEPTVSVRRPFGYLLEPGCEKAVTKLRQHGIEVVEWRGEAQVESYAITTIRRARRSFQAHELVSLEVEATDRTLPFPEGSMWVPTAQKLGNLVVYLLEPQSTDGLAAWNFLDDHLAEGSVFPVHRVRTPKDLNEE
jgi:dipeptidyl-peptidase 4